MSTQTVAGVMGSLLAAIRAGVPELLEVETVKGQLDPEELKGRLAKLPAAYIALAGMKDGARQRVGRTDKSYLLTFALFLVVPARKDGPEPLPLLQKVADLVGGSAAAYAGPGSQTTFDHMDNLLGADAGRDWIYLYALRWSVSCLVAPQ
ncbi:hypothetical protein CCP1ISM_140011 [Azospirillaceae bacterium]